MENKEQPKFINKFSESLLKEFYTKPGESINECFYRATNAFCYGDFGLRDRLISYLNNNWMMFASPIISNAGSGEWVKNPRSTSWSDEYLWDGESPIGMPISCFAMTADDTLIGQIQGATELSWLSVSGGGVGVHNLIRATSKKAPGPIPYMKTLDSIIGYYKQGKTRRGAVAYYMDINHPDIVEHIKFRDRSHGDPARKADNTTQFHVGVNITDEFIHAVDNDLMFNLVCPHSKEIRETVKARDLWETILDMRAFRGEPYLFKIDTANRALPKAQKDLGLRVNGSNICAEITLVTNDLRTFVCCLSSLNLETYDEWKDTDIVADLTKFLDNVLQYFIDHAPSYLEKAKYSAERERAIGIGTMGWAYYLQKKGIPWEGGGFNSAIHHTHMIFSKIKSQAEAASQALGVTRGECPDMIGTGRRNSHLLAIAPNSNNSIIASTSPSIEPVEVAYPQSTRAGTYLVKSPYFEKYMEQHAVDHGYDSDWVELQWKSILEDKGSVQGLDWVSSEVKNIFKAPYEIDQRWLIEQADARQQYVCQSQSLNLFFPEKVDAAYFNACHLKAMRAKFLKSVYYCRMKREVSADTVKQIERHVIETNESSCLACEA